MTALTSAPVQRRRPNVLLIILDDLGSLDLNCYGSHDLITPNLDALAASGIRFTQFYSAAPICSASRGGTLTGRYPQRNGLTENASSQPGGGASLPASERHPRQHPQRRRLRHRPRRQMASRLHPRHHSRRPRL